MIDGDGVKWRFFELKNGEYLTLFHAVNGSRRIPKGKWVDAKQVITYDGRGSTMYRAGFHVFTDFSIAEEFIKKFRAPRTIVVVEVDVAGSMRLKPTNNKVLLVSKMRIPKNATHIVLMHP
jgi:hypothetical protein